MEAVSCQSIRAMRDLDEFVVMPPVRWVTHEILEYLKMGTFPLPIPPLVPWHNVKNRRLRISAPGATTGNRFMVLVIC